MNWIRSIERPVRKTQPSTSAGLLLTRNPVDVENTILAIIIVIVTITMNESSPGEVVEDGEGQ